MCKEKIYTFVNCIFEKRKKKAKYWLSQWVQTVGGIDSGPL